MLALLIFSWPVVVVPLASIGHRFLGIAESIDLSALADGSLALADCLVAGTIFYLLHRRREFPTRTFFWILAALLLAGGATHLFNAVERWQPLQGVKELINAIAATISLATAGALIFLARRSLGQPNPAAFPPVHDLPAPNLQFPTANLSVAVQPAAPVVEQSVQGDAEVRRLNESLQQRVNELQALLDLLPVGIAIAQDAECRDIRTNRVFAEMLGISQPENASLARPPVEAPSLAVLRKSPELQLEESPMQRAVRENRSVLDVEQTIRRNDGRELHVVLSAVPLRDAAGKPRGSVAAMQDITAQKLAAEERLAFERRLRETQKLESLGVLAGGIAHDFNNLLTGILGNASIARLELPSGYAPVRAALDNLEHAAMRAADLCKQMLAYAGKGRFVVQPLSLSGLVKETAELFETSRHKKAALQLHLAEGLPAFQGDATQVRQVLMNLVINASEAIGDGPGVISIRTSVIDVTPDFLTTAGFDDEMQEGRYLCLEVSDTGPGMDKIMVARIFDPFFTTKFTGRGLGLAAVLGIVRGHKGAIKVESELGQGTTFRLLFPAHASPATPADPLTQAKFSGKYQGTILVVDDEESVRSVATRILRNVGFKVVNADDGLKAVELVRTASEPFTAVLLDLTMPRMDGEEAFRLMRQLKPDLRVIVMSGFNEQDTTDRFVGGGLAGFVAKPFTAEMLLGKVTAVLRTAAAR